MFNKNGIIKVDFFFSQLKSNFEEAYSKNKCSLDTGREEHYTQLSSMGGHLFILSMVFNLFKIVGQALKLNLSEFGLNHMNLACKINFFLKSRVRRDSPT